MGLFICGHFRLRSSTMGAYKYMQELYRKKQCDVMRFLQRVRCWQYRQLSPSIGHPVPLALTRLAVWDTVPSRVTSSTASVSAVEDARGPCLWEPHMASPPTRESTLLRTSVLTRLLLRSVLVVAARLCAYSHPTGLVRIPPTSTMRSL